MATNKDIIDAIARVEGKVDRVDEKVDRTAVRIDGLHVRMDNLVETTNHRLDDFTTAIDSKLDNSELLTSLGFKLLNNKFIRWGLGVALAAVAGTTTYQYWHVIVGNFLERIGLA
jgi:hypothetical protein